MALAEQEPYQQAANHIPAGLAVARVSVEAQWSSHWVRSQSNLRNLEESPGDSPREKPPAA